MKRFYKENRVFVILMGIVLVCVAIILGLAVRYIINSNSADKYGNRLDGIDDVIISDKMKDDIESSILENEHVQSAKLDVRGKTVYIIIDFDNEATVEIAKNTANSSLALLEEEYLNFYSLQFQLTKSKNEDESTTTFPIFGGMKVGASTISWSNNAN